MQSSNSPAVSPARRAGSTSTSASVACITSIRPGNNAQPRQVWGTRADDKRSAPINMPKTGFTSQTWKIVMKHDPTDFTLGEALRLYRDSVTGRYTLQASAAQASDKAPTQGDHERGRRTAREEAEAARLRSQSRRASDSAVQSAFLDKPGDSVTGSAKFGPAFTFRAGGLEFRRPLLAIKAAKTDKVFKLLLTPGHGVDLKRTFGGQGVPENLRYTFVQRRNGSRGGAVYELFFEFGDRRYSVSTWSVYAGFYRDDEEDETVRWNSRSVAPGKHAAETAPSPPSPPPEMRSGRQRERSAAASVASATNSTEPIARGARVPERSISRRRADADVGTKVLEKVGDAAAGTGIIFNKHTREDYTVQPGNILRSRMRDTLVVTTKRGSIFKFVILDALLLRLEGLMNTAPSVTAMWHIRRTKATVVLELHRGTERTIMTGFEYRNGRYRQSKNCEVKGAGV